jgi:hypothetical protein
MLCLRSAARLSLLSLAFAVVLATPASAQGVPDAPPPAPATPARSSARGVAIVALGPPQGAAGSVRDEAFALARSVYGSALRPPALDEVRARILAGDPAPATTTTSQRELAELRGSLHGNDAASRRLLSGIGRDINARGLLVVSRGAPPDNSPPADPDAGAPSPDVQGRVIAQLFDVETGVYDAARYEPDPSASSPWQATVQSVLLRYPPPASSSPRISAVPPPPPPADSEPPHRPFYLSPWFWGAVGGAVLLGGFIYVASRDSSNGSIHLQMQVPH